MKLERCLLRQYLAMASKLGEMQKAFRDPFNMRGCGIVMGRHGWFVVLARGSCQDGGGGEGGGSSKSKSNSAAFLGFLHSLNSGGGGGCRDAENLACNMELFATGWFADVAHVGGSGLFCFLGDPLDRQHIERSQLLTLAALHFEKKQKVRSSQIA